MNQNIHTTLLVSCYPAGSAHSMSLAADTLRSYYLGSREGDSLTDIKRLEFPSDISTEHAVQSILAHPPDSIGLSMYIWNRRLLLDAARMIRESHPQITIYAGGAEVTAAPESLEAESCLDFIIPGEGELPFARLMDYLSGKTVLSPDGSHLEAEPQHPAEAEPQPLPEARPQLPAEAKPPERLCRRESLHDINQITSPFLHGSALLDPDGKNRTVVLWELSRGCPYNCAFCAESRGSRGIRYIDEARIAAELQLFEERGVDQVFVLDPTFNTKNDRALAILELIRTHAPAIHFTFEVRAELLTAEQAQGFSNIHCSLQIGLQSAHDEVLRKVNRSIRQQDYREKINLLNEYGVIFGLDLIYGLPGDSLEGFRESLNYALGCLPNHLDIFRLSVFPGTELFDKAKELGLEWLPDAPYTVTSAPGFTGAELEKAASLADAADRFYNKGASVAWLLPLCEALDMTPSDFLEFAAGIEMSPGTMGSEAHQRGDSQRGDSQSSDSLLQWQLEVLRLAFRKQKRKQYGKMAGDLCTFHHFYSRALKATPEPKDLRITPESILSRADGLFALNLEYDVNIYSEWGMFSIVEALKEIESSPCHALIFPGPEGIMSPEIEEEYFHLIQNLDGKRSLRAILKQVDLAFEDSVELLEFLAQCGCIVSS